MFSDLLYRFRALLCRQSVEEELQEELQYHLDRATEKYRSRGMLREEALRCARLAIGGPEQMRQQSRDGRGIKLFEDLLQDVRYGARSLRKSPGFTAVTMLTLALGIGTCTAVFSVLNAVLIRSLPYGHADRLVYLFTPNPHMNNLPVEAFGPSYADFFDIQRQAHSFTSLSAFETASFSSASAETAVRVQGARVDGSFFSTLQSTPAHGRAIEPADDRSGHGNVAVISNALWRSMFAGSPQVLSKSLRLNGSAYQIIGVMPPGFAYPHETDLPAGVLGNIGKADLWIPLALSPQRRADRDNFYATVIARLKPGVSLRQAQAETSALMAVLNPLHQGDLRGWGALLEPFRDNAIGPARRLMWLLLGAVSFVLFIACGNAANLLLARAAARTHEFGVRATLGAARGRIIRQMLTESLLLGLGGGCTGIVLAYVFLHGLLRLSPGDIPRLEEASIDGRVLGFAFLLAVLTTLIFGILPSLLASRLDLLTFLKSGGHRGSLGAGNRVRSSLIVGELALVVVLLAGAGLLLHSYVKVEGVQTGFSSSTVSMDIQVDAKYRNGTQIQAFYQTLLGKVQGTSGVSSAGLINTLPLSRNENVSGFFVDGYPNQKEQLVQDRYITPQYFSAMGIPVVEGRSFQDGDTPHSPFVVIVNQAFAKKYFNGRDPVGLRMRTSGPGNPWRRVIGVVRSVPQTSLEAAPAPEVYEPIPQTANDIDGGASLVIRSALPPDQVTTAVRAALKTIDPDLAPANIQTMGDLVSQAIAQRRFQMTLVSTFAAMAVCLGMIGIYGLLAYSVKQRTSEIGLRIALGASRGRVLGMVLRQGLKITSAGLVLGLAGAFATTRLLASSLYGVNAVDPITFAAVPLLLLLITVAACLIPAGRAASVDPMTTIRYE